jgi:hypothetical protein
MKTKCRLVAEGRQFSCRQLWLDRGPSAWCEECRKEAWQMVERTVKSLGLPPLTTPDWL